MIFALISPQCKIDLTVKFKDMGIYDESRLEEIFRKNIALEVKCKTEEHKLKNRIAYSLIAIGIVFFLAMLLINHVWNRESVWKEIFVYISDIATTVTFWEAMTILVVEQKENRTYLKNLRGRFSAIRFGQA